MNHPVQRRGQPMVALAVVLTVWVAGRAVMWERAPETGTELPSIIAAPAQIASLPVAALQADTPGNRAAHAPNPSSRQHSYRSPPLAAGYLLPREQGGDAASRDVPVAVVPALPWLPYISPDAKPGSRRWSADGWLLLRDGGASSPITGPARATYGASQLGAVLRYRLAPESGHRPTAYLRGTAALVRPHDREVATGFSVRPIPSLPFTLAAELRAGEINSATRVRPAIMAVTELLPQKLPLDLQGEAYAQAGYVGGKGATTFIDGQFRVDRGVARFRRAELRFGGGVWGGAQKDASRLDLGPAVTLGISLSDIVFARVTADWRFRVAGNAVPESGPALTLSAGF